MMPNHLPLQSCSQSRDLSSHQDSLAPSWTGYARPSPENNNRKYMQISNSTQHSTRHKSSALRIYNNYSINLSITFLHIETAGYNNCKRKSIKLQLTLHKGETNRSHGLFLPTTGAQRQIFYGATTNLRQGS